MDLWTGRVTCNKTPVQNYTKSLSFDLKTALILFVFFTVAKEFNHTSFWPPLLPPSHTPPLTVCAVTSRAVCPLVLWHHRLWVAQLCRKKRRPFFFLQAKCPPTPLECKRGGLKNEDRESGRRFMQSGQRRGQLRRCTLRRARWRPLFCLTLPSSHINKPLWQWRMIRKHLGLQVCVGLADQCKRTLG